MPWYVADYLADTANLNTEQHGAYCLMLMAAWKRGGSLPHDDAQLAAVCRLTASKWRAYKAVLLEFFEDMGSSYSHKRVTAERLKAQEISDKKGVSGAEGAAKRWGKEMAKAGMIDGKEMANAMANAMADPMANASQNDAPSPSPSPLPTPTELIKEPDGSLSTASPLPTCPHAKVIELFSQKLPELPKPKPEFWAGKSADHLRARWKFLMTKTRADGTRYATTEAEALEWFERFFDHVSASDWLMGRSGNFKCTLQWLVNAENFGKTVQGNYDNK